jgi:hypothetical protein
MSETASWLSVGELREALIDAMDLGGVLGANLHESKKAVIQVKDDFWYVAVVKTCFRNGRFVLVLEAGDPFVPMTREEAERAIAALQSHTHATDLDADTCPACFPPDHPSESE